MINFILFLIGLTSFNLIMIFHLNILKGKYFNKTILQIFAVGIFLGIMSLKDTLLNIESIVNPLWILIIIAIILVSLLSKVLYNMNKKGDDSAVIFILLRYFFLLLIGVLVVSC
jgi:hypothetical protein